jgi:protein-tyrosine-phosphatase
MNEQISSYLQNRLTEFDLIGDERKKDLGKIALFIESQIKAGRTARLTFICTHNSRRSHISQIWAQTAASHFGISKVETFSGGTEATALDPRAVAALERTGFSIKKTSEKANPVYRLRFGQGTRVIEAFSKVYNQPPNPEADFCAVMTCSQADKDCPVVFGAALRVAVPYEDPQGFDGTELETAKYDERCRQISREMLYLFSLVNA